MRRPLHRPRRAQHGHATRRTARTSLPSVCEVTGATTAAVAVVAAAGAGLVGRSGAWQRQRRQCHSRRQRGVRKGHADPGPSWMAAARSACPRSVWSSVWSSCVWVTANGCECGGWGWATAASADRRPPARPSRPQRTAGGTPRREAGWAGSAGSAGSVGALPEARRHRYPFVFCEFSCKIVGIEAPRISISMSR